MGLQGGIPLPTDGGGMVLVLLLCLRPPIVTIPIVVMVPHKLIYSGGGLLEPSTSLENVFF